MTKAKKRPEAKKKLRNNYKNTAHALAVAVIFVSSFFFVFEAFASSQYQGAGFGDSNVNTIFSDSGNVNNGQPVYCNSPYTYTLVYDGSKWDLSSGGTCASPTNCAYEQSSNSLTPDGVAYVDRGCGETSPGGTMTLVAPPPSSPGFPTSTLPSWIGLSAFDMVATSTNAATGTVVWTASYLVNSTTQAIINTFTDRTQENIFEGFILFLIVSGGMLYYFQNRWKKK